MWLQVNVSVLVTAERMQERVPPSSTEKPKELSSLTPSGETSLKQGVLMLRQELKGSRMFQQARCTGSTPICKEFPS